MRHCSISRGRDVRTAVARFLRAFVMAVVAAAATALAGSPASAQRMPGDTIEVLSLRFEGARRVPAQLLRTAISTERTECVSAALQPFCWLGMSLDRKYLDPRMLPADSLRLWLFYRQRGYRDAVIGLDTARVPGGVHITFRIDEGEPVIVQSLLIETDEDLPGAVTRNLPLRVGGPFDEILFEATRDTIIARLANRGHAAADVLANYDIRSDDPHHADVEYQVMAGPIMRFGPVAVQGVEQVSPAVVERMLDFREGDTYSRQALLRSQRNLFGLEVFRHADIATASPLGGDTILPVTVRVTEGDMHRIRVGLGASTTDFLNAEGRWVSRNFLGGGRRLELRGRISNLVAQPLGPLPLFESCTGIYCDVAGSLNADFSQPWLFGPRNTLGAGLFLERFTLPGVYVHTSSGGYVSLRRNVLGSGVLTGVYRPEVTRLESDGDLIFCVNFIACEEREIDVLRDPHWLAPVSLSFTRDRSNSLFAPTRGWIARVDGEYAGPVTGSDYTYARLQGEFTFYHDPFRGVVFATRLRPGWARAVGAPGSGLGLHPQKRFFAGGPNSVRGFAHYRLGPRLLTVGADTLVVPVAGGGAGCTAQEVNAGTCDVTTFAEAHPGAFEQRPVGGAVVLEGNFEVRFPVWRDQLRAAAFVDFGQVWRTQEDVRASGLRFTPGIGVRYFSPIGPLRIDVGYNPGGTERLTVITTELCDRRQGQDPCGDILPDEVYAPGDLGVLRKLRTLPAIDWRPFDSFMDRLQFHFSIGQAF